jgi:hypothetical protein|tara:strand:- start:473 stop:730 length:258 start_codon:yes stop_codon:yes gene_type:complete
MKKKILNMLVLSLFALFISLLFYFYFSDKNILNTNRSRSLSSLNFKLSLSNLPLLKNDTNNITDYATNNEKNKKKYNLFWNLIKN